MEKRYVALKIVSANGSSQCQELEILQYLGQLNIDLAENFICPLLDHFWIQGPNGSHVCLVLPLAGLQVFDEIENSESYTNVERVAGTRYYGRQLAHAVALLHSVGIVHGGKNEIPMTINIQHYLMLV
jgi:serine/threonine protein kinase